MKHAFLLIVVCIAGYIAWQFMDKSERKRASVLFTKHGIRLGLLLLVIALLLALAVQLPATNLI